MTPLTAGQQRAVDALVGTGRLERVPVDQGRGADFLAQAAAALTDLPNLTQLSNRYTLSYDAAHDVGEAMLRAYGYRTRPGSGQLDALGRFLAAVFDTPPENAAARHYDRMRRERNRQRYDARPVTAAAAEAAAQAAATLLNAARQRAGVRR